MTRTALLGLTCLLTTGMLAVAGCGGGSDDATPSGRRGAERPQARVVGPAYDAPAAEVAEFVGGGTWTVTLLPEAGRVADVEPPTIRADFDVTSPDGGDGRLEVSEVGGSVGDGAIRGGRLVVSPGGRALPQLRYETGDVTIESLAGGTTTVTGPIRWQAELYRGRLIGTATGPNGQRSAWEATRGR